MHEGFGCCPSSCSLAIIHPWECWVLAVIMEVVTAQLAPNPHCEQGLAVLGVGCWCCLILLWSTQWAGLVRLGQVMWPLDHHQPAVTLWAASCRSGSRFWVDVLHWRQVSCMSDVALERVVGWCVPLHMSPVPLPVLCWARVVIINS